MTESEGAFNHNATSTNLMSRMVDHPSPTALHAYLGGGGISGEPRVVDDDHPLAHERAGLVEEHTVLDLVLEGGAEEPEELSHVEAGLWATKHHALDGIDLEGEKH